jgi:hypothetical protein
VRRRRLAPLTGLIAVTILLGVSTAITTVLGNLETSAVMAVEVLRLLESWGAGFAVVAGGSIAAATAAGVWRARSATAHLVSFGRAAHALGVRGAGTLGPWGADRDGLRVELDADEWVLRVAGLPPDETLGPGPGADSGDPDFDRAVRVDRSNFGARDRATLQAAVQRGFTARRGVLTRPIASREQGELVALAGVALEVARALRDGVATWDGLAASDPSPAVRRRALRRCAHRQPPEWLRARLDDPDPTVVALAAEPLLPETTDRLLALAHRPEGREALRICLDRGVGDPDTLLVSAWARGDRDPQLLGLVGAHGGELWFGPLAAEPSAGPALLALRERLGDPDPGRLSLAAADGGELAEEAPLAGALAEPAAGERGLHTPHQRFTDP